MKTVIAKFLSYKNSYELATVSGVSTISTYAPEDSCSLDIMTESDYFFADANLKAQTSCETNNDAANIITLLNMLPAVTENPFTLCAEYDKRADADADITELAIMTSDLVNGEMFLATFIEDDTCAMCAVIDGRMYKINFPDDEPFNETNPVYLSYFAQLVSMSVLHNINKSL